PKVRESGGLPPPKKHLPSSFGQGPATPHLIRPAAPPTSSFGPGLSGVSCGPRAFASGSPSADHYATRRPSCQVFIRLPTGWFSVGPAGVDLVELADQGGELEFALAGDLVAETVELGARLAGDVVAHGADRAGGAGVDLDLAGALEAIEPDERLGHAAPGGEQA